MRALLATLLLAALLPLATPGGAAAGAIQPGDVVTTSSGQCTLNFVFDGTGPLAGNVYVGIAAHCVDDLGQRASTTGHADFGTVAFLGDADDSARDYAFVQVNDDLEGLVKAEVLGHPGWPTGGATASARTSSGDLLFFSGHGVIFGLTAPTREDRAGLLTFDDAQLYRGEGPILFGDSGGPVLHETGMALGIVSQIVVGCCPEGGQGTWIEGPTVHGIVADASAHRFPVALRNAA